jgi:hypothetical protein
MRVEVEQLAALASDDSLGTGPAACRRRPPETHAGTRRSGREQHPGRRSRSRGSDGRRAPHSGAGSPGWAGSARRRPSRSGRSGGPERGRGRCARVAGRGRRVCGPGRDSSALQPRETETTALSFQQRPSDQAHIREMRLCRGTDQADSALRVRSGMVPVPGSRERGSLCDHRAVRSRGGLSRRPGDLPGQRLGPFRASAEPRGPGEDRRGLGSRRSVQKGPATRRHRARLLAALSTAGRHPVGADGESQNQVRTPI